MPQDTISRISRDHHVTGRSGRKHFKFYVSATACMVSLLLAAAPSMAQRPLGVDVSVWNGTINWTQVKNSGRVFAFVKATQGTKLVDSRFLSNMANAKAAGVYVGCYHFADPLNYYQQGYPPHTAIDEANYFLNAARPYIIAGNMRPVLDLEQGAGLGGTGLSNWANDFCNHVYQQTGARPFIYTGGNFARNYLNSSVTQWDLWFAYPDDPPNYYYDPQNQNPPTYWLGNWPTWTFWQYSWEGSVPGVESTNTDLNAFNGTLAQLQATALITGASVISRSPAALTPTVRSGLNAAQQSFTIWNSGEGLLSFNVESNVSWATVSPASGSSIGASDVKTITVSYPSQALKPGTYTGAVTITAAGATNSPQTVSLTLNVQPVPGDLDADGDIDTTDVNAFFSCMTGPLQTQSNPACAGANFNGDQDVDQEDFGILQKCISGPSVAPDPYCPGR